MNLRLILFSELSFEAFLLSRFGLRPVDYCAELTGCSGCGRGFWSWLGLGCRHSLRPLTAFGLVYGLVQDYLLSER